ncbi:hypothetical protein N7462_005310, partial [Penicillium macrosclerotiorum]|uniref:uncharacterized protein n=1 Tax=Penicillium macrosclerotiorum TaxID=303699 RepID=UPI002546EF95
GLGVTWALAHGRPLLLPPVLRVGRAYDTSSGLPEIFSNNTSDSNSSTVPSDFDDSSESESEFYKGAKRDPRRLSASLRLSFPSGVTSDGERTDYLIYKAEVGHSLSKDIQVKIRDVLAIVATDKKLSLKKRPKATIFVEDIAKFTRDLNGGHPRLFIYLRPEFIKAFLIPEIIFDPTLVLSPYIFLLGILFRISAFKSLCNDSPVLDYPKKLYRLRVLYSLGE